MLGKIISLIGLVILTVVIAAVCLSGVDKFALLKEKEIENEARFQCAQSSRYQVQTSKDVIVWYPIQDLYTACLSEKGIQ
jgi:hypothetical protein